jgi:hypothetical protein
MKYHGINWEKGVQKDEQEEKKHINYIGNCCRICNHNYNFKVIGVNAFLGTEISKDLADYAICGDNVLIHFPNEETVIVPDGVKVVSDTGHKRKCIIKEMYIPDTVTYICGDLIENCRDLKIYIPSSVEGIGTIENYKIAYECIDEITFVVESGSYAESYAIENNINYEIVDSVQALYEAAVASESE